MRRMVEEKTRLPAGLMAVAMLLLLGGAALHLKIASAPLEEARKIKRWSRERVPVHPKDPEITPESPEHIEAMAAVERIRIFFSAGGLPSGIGPGSGDYQAAVQTLHRLELRLLYELEELVLDDGEDMFVRGAILDVIAKHRENAMWQFLAGLFVEPSEDHYLRSKSLDHLLAYETEENFKILKQVFDTEPDFPDRFRLIHAMGRTKCELAVPTLLALVGDDQPLQSRCAGAQALGNFVDRPEVRARLLALAGGDNSMPVRQNALLSLAPVAGEDVDDLCRRIADNPREPEGLRRTARLHLERRK